MKLGKNFTPSNPSKGTKKWRFPPRTSKFGSIHANIHAPFKRPLIPFSRRVHRPLPVPMLLGHSLKAVPPMLLKAMPLMFLMLLNVALKQLVLRMCVMPLCFS